MKIGLIAMSGIRACDTELLELGLTLPGFVERSKTIASLPSLGLLTLAPDNFDLVAISSYSAQINEAYELALRYKKKGIPVVMGGPHVTVLPEEALEFCDSVVIGEGEQSWLEVLRDTESSKLKSRYGTRQSDYEMSDSPMPRFDLLDIKKYNRLTIQTSRGCPHQCEFCASSVILTNCYKQKPVSNVLKEIDCILDLWKHPFIEFADDNSFVNHNYWKKLLPNLKDKGIRWFAETDLSVAEDPELLKLMREAGCVQLLIGLESPEKASLHKVEIKNDWKYKHFQEYKSAINTIQSHGITVNGCFVLGLDGQTTDVFDQVFEFVKSTELYEVQATIMTPFPGTVLYDRLKNEDRLIEAGNWKKCTLFDINFIPVKMSVEDLDRNFKKLVGKLYNEKFTAWRRSNFKRNLRLQKF